MDTYYTLEKEATNHLAELSNELKKTNLDVAALKII